MRIASFNVENLFDRAKALDPTDWDKGRPTLEKHDRISELLNEPQYTEPVKVEIAKLLTELGLDERDDGGEFAQLRQNRGRLLIRHNDGTLEIIASGRADWIGWVELKKESVDELATRHTAIVIQDVNADILGVVEGDSRTALSDFSSIMLRKIGSTPFDHVMLIDGNDDRGIDVGILTRGGYEIVAIRSHIDDTDAEGEIFSRDCPEYTIATPYGEEIVVLVNHFKSKGHGPSAESNAKRSRQATRVAQIYRRLRKEGQANVVVLGDFNDLPDSAPLKPLLNRTGLHDISAHPAFSTDGRPGTWRNGTKSQKLDYLLLSPALFKKVSGGAVFRKGVWGGKNGTLFPHYDTMTKEVHAASDHAAIYADLTM